MQLAAAHVLAPQAPRRAALGRRSVAPVCAAGESPLPGHSRRGPAPPAAQAARTKAQVGLGRAPRLGFGACQWLGGRYLHSLPACPLPCLTPSPHDLNAARVYP